MQIQDRWRLKPYNQSWFPVPVLLPIQNRDRHQLKEFYIQLLR
jgi:hypothetical protein